MKTEASPEISKVISKWPLASALLSIGFGAVVLAGWAFRILALRTFIPGQVAIKANTGACFLLLGIALWLANTGTGRRWLSRWATISLAAIVAVVGLVSFFEYRFHWDAGIDQILFTVGPEDLPGSVRVGLMSPLAAVSFGLLGTATLLLDLRRRWVQVLVQTLTACSAIVSMFGILDYVIEPSATYTHIGPPTALVMLLVSFGVMFSRPVCGLSALVNSPRSGGKLLRRLIPASIAPHPHCLAGMAGRHRRTLFDLDRARADHRRVGCAADCGRFLDGSGNESSREHSTEGIRVDTVAGGGGELFQRSHRRRNA